jgi:hypothetical protein
MNDVKAAARWNVWLFWSGGATALIFTVSRFVTGTPLGRHGGIDDSYMQALHAAFVGHWQFGRDVVFTFGPWGFLYGGYHPATHFLATLVWLGLAVLFTWAGWRAGQGFSGSPLGRWSWLVVFTAIAGFNLFLNIDVRLNAWVVLLWVLYFFVETKPLTVVQAAVVVALGLLSLVKFHLAVLVFLSLLIMAADTVLRYRRFPWALPLYCCSVLIFWVAAGQQFGCLGPYLASSWRLAGQYTEAVMLQGTNAGRDIAWYVCASLPLLAMAGIAGWKRYQWHGIFPLAVLGLLIFTTFKHGYVRHDGHEVAAWLELVMISLACLAIVWPLTRNHPRWWGMVSCLPVLLAVLCASATFSRYSETGLLVKLAQTLGPRSFASSFRALFSPGSLCQDYEAYLADLRSRWPLPRIEGYTDIYPCNQAALLAHGISYRPRPLLQSYCAYSPELADLDAA